MSSSVQLYLCCNTPEKISHHSFDVTNYGTSYNHLHSRCSRIHQHFTGPLKLTTSPGIQKRESSRRVYMHSKPFRTHTRTTTAATSAATSAATTAATTPATTAATNSSYNSK